MLSCVTPCDFTSVLLLHTHVRLTTHTLYAMHVSIPCNPTKNTWTLAPIWYLLPLFHAVLLFHAEHMKFMDSLAHIFIIKNFNYFLVTIPQCVDIKSVCLQIVLCHIVWFLKTLFEWLTWVSHTSQKSLSNIWFWVEIEFSIISIPQQPLATHSSSSSVWVLVKISHSRWHANRYGLVKCVS